jgi:prophage regulatory protein
MRTTTPRKTIVSSSDSSIRQPAIQSQPPLLGLLRLHQVLGLVGCSRSTWSSWVKAKRVPEPVRFSSRLVLWRLQDIERLLAEGPAEGVQPSPEEAAKTAARLRALAARKLAIRATSHVEAGHV